MAASATSPKKEKRKDSDRACGSSALLAAPPRSAARSWAYPVGIAAAFVAAFVVYGGSLHGPFLFDDLHMPYANVVYAHLPLAAWVHIIRPLMMLTFWINFQLTAFDSYSYHMFNVLLHVANSVLLFFIVRNLLQGVGTASRRLEIVAAFVAGLFLVHPVQTESVTYIASRSETLCLMFVYGAWAVFLYRKNRAMTWQTAAAVLVLIGLAEASKEHGIALLPVLLLTDYFWNPGFSPTGIRRNWRLYAASLALGAIGVYFVLTILHASKAAGFELRGVPWYVYLFTQFRVIWHYVRLFFVPYGQTIDADMPFSRGLLDHGAIFGLLGLLLVTAAAVVYRRRYPLAAYGWLTFLLLVAPTSSFVPLADASVEHRLYMPMIGLLLVLAEWLRRLKVSDNALAGTLAAVLVIFGAMAKERNQLWANTTALWEDAAAKAPNKPRPHFQLAYAYFKLGRCAAALPEYQAAWRAGNHEGTLLADWGLAYDCNNQRDEAIAKLREAAATPLERSHIAHIWSLIGMVYDKQGNTQQALEALSTGERIDPGAVNIYFVRGTLWARANRFPEAAAEYRRVLAIDPYHEEARTALEAVEGEAYSGR